MTLGEAKTKVYMLLDEHSAGGDVEHDGDIEEKMCFFFDIAQKETAKRAPILRTKRIVPTAGRTEYPLPEDFMALVRVWLDGKSAPGRFAFRAGRLLIPASCAGREVVLEYAAVPETIAAGTPDSYEFELREDACTALPYYVAAQQLLPDLVMDYSAMLGMYERCLQALSAAVPGEGARMTQRLFRG